MARNILLTGVSSGIGHALAEQLLAQGDIVYGISRREPKKFRQSSTFHFASVDLTDHGATSTEIAQLLQGVESLDLVILNAGVLSSFGDMAEVDLDELREVMEINVWANKTLLDTLFVDTRPIRQVVAISSGASVNGNRGWNGYSISKAALNMLTRLYAEERPETHFSALAPGIVDTAMQAAVAAMPDDERFPALARLRQKRGTADMPLPHEAAVTLLAQIDRLPSLVPSGAYADVRQPPLT